MVIRAKDILLRGREVYDQINILGDDGVPLNYHVQFWKAEVIDFVILQQDAFDSIDAMTPIERQRFMLEHVLQICQMEFDFKGFEEVATFFKRIINNLKQLNYSRYESEEFNKILEDQKLIINEKRIA
jgi:V/A-type H+-transporting ATPase subunit A